MTRSTLDELAARYGIGEAYHDHRGELRVFSANTKIALLAAMGVDAGSWPALEKSLRNTETGGTGTLPAVQVLRQGDPALISLPAAALVDTTVLRWTLHTEADGNFSGEIPVTSLPVESGNASWHIPVDLPAGYHRLVLRTDTAVPAEMRVIVAPAQCYQPPVLQGERRLWGVTLQLYTLKSGGNWGVGDFSDLCEVIEWAAPLGCALVGLNPLHALRPADPTHISPYSPSSRQFLNFLYIAVPQVPEFAECESVQHLAQAAEQDVLIRLRSVGNVDYAGVAQLKRGALRLLYDYFCTKHLAAGTARGRAFLDFVRQGGEPLRLHAVFDALDADLRRRSEKYWGWPDWPEPYQNPSSPQVRQFADEHKSDVEFYLYLQWLASEQLAGAQQLARKKGMALGLYGDVAVGVSSGGSETWSNPRLYVMQAGIGAPPDPLALKGQDWGIPPQSPRELKIQGYQPFIDLLRLNMRHVAALRLDHVMALFRQWWVPRGFVATEGAYVHYPLDDLMGILALESHRNRCVVIGEDLGTVPDAVRFAMHKYAVAHYKVLLFEKERDGRFKTPGAYEQQSLAAVTTHDLPTFRGWWQCADIEIASRLGLYPDAATRERVIAEREIDRRLLMSALVNAGLWHWQEHEALPACSHALVRAAHLYLALSNAELAVVQIEDLAGMEDPVNIPGTHTEYPNWQRRMRHAAPQIFGREEVREMLAAMSIARTGRNPN